MSFKNIILMADSYKVGHWDMLPSNTTKTYFYQEARKGAKFDTVVPFGLQYILKTYLEGTVVNQEMIEEADALFSSHFGDSTIFNRAGWEYIVKNHNGRLPISIKAIPEGTPVPISNALLTIENTDPNCAWLSGYLETLLSIVWHPSTVASQGREIKKIVKYWLNKTGGSEEFLPFAVHDFSARGVEAPEVNSLGCAAHLVNFQGTDTILALKMLKDNYSSTMAGYSIRASEHSATTIFLKEGEEEFYRNYVSKYPNGIIAMVMDSYDLDNAFQNIVPQLKDIIMSRNGRVVFRPDSGSPIDMPVIVHNYLGKIFGYTMNDKGYKVLPPQVGVIQGDGMNFETIGKVLSNLASSGWSTSNFAMGVGSGLVQQLNRDTMRYAIKLSSAVVNGKERGVQKMPKTDPTKASKKGRLKVINNNGIIETVSENAVGEDMLVEIFRDGKILIEYTLDEIRGRSRI